MLAAQTNAQSRQRPEGEIEAAAIRTRNESLALFFLLAVYILYAAIYIYRTSVVVRGERYFVLFEDAMISMRYARNLASGFGLVWNPGERVEGYTNLLWTIWMALFHLLPVPASKTSLFIQISGALFLAINLYFVYKLCRNISNDALAALAAVILVAFYAPLNMWSLLGMEVSVLTLIVTMALWLVLCNYSSGKIPWIYLLLGTATLVRIDMCPIYLLILAYAIIVNKGDRYRHAAWGVGLLVFFVGGQEIFRFLYYHSWLPNTYYLKMENFPLDLRLARGLSVLRDMTGQYKWIVIFLPAGALLFERNRRMVLLGLTLMCQVFYSIYVGGDAWENGGANRFIAIVAPVYFILFAYTLGQIRQYAVRSLARRARFAAAASWVVFSLLVIASMVILNYSPGDKRSLQRWALLAPSLYQESDGRLVLEALTVESITTADARVAVPGAGIVPYFLDRYTIDLLGKNDPVIAHGFPNVPLNLANASNLRPGHMKWNYAWSVGILQPDVIVALWQPDDKAEALMNRYRQGGMGSLRYFYLLRDSPNILWDRVEFK